jgi:hypothetical protein
MREWEWWPLYLNLVWIAIENLVFGSYLCCAFFTILICCPPDLRSLPFSVFWSCLAQPDFLPPRIDFSSWEPIQFVVPTVRFHFSAVVRSQIRACAWPKFSRVRRSSSGFWLISAGSALQGSRFWCAGFGFRTSGLDSLRCLINVYLEGLFIWIVISGYYNICNASVHLP